MAELLDRAIAERSRAGRLRGICLSGCHHCSIITRKPPNTPLPGHAPQRDPPAVHDLRRAVDLIGLLRVLSLR